MTTYDAGCVTIGSDSVRVAIDPVHGGRIAQLSFEETDLLVGADSSGGDPVRGTTAASAASRSS